MVTLASRTLALDPLDDFYASLGLSLPAIQRIAADALPQPYRHLLVHEGDMTGRLAAYHRQAIELRVQERFLRGQELYRRVVLLRGGDGRPVEFGAIRIPLEPFPPAAREDILDGHTPLGAVLHRHGVAHRSQPSAYLQVVSDHTINQALGLGVMTRLYGRCNTLLDPAGHRLATVVEILPPEPTPS